MYILNSILDNIESTLYQGDRVVGPFYILDIQNIELATNHVTNIASILIDNAINIDKLFKKTECFDYEIWKHLTYTNQFINRSEKANENLLRFIWYLCYKLVYKETDLSRPIKIYIDDILKDDVKIHNKAYNMFLVHIYTRFDYYILDFSSCVGTIIKIKFKNNSSL